MCFSVMRTVGLLKELGNDWLMHMDLTHSERGP